MQENGRGASETRAACIDAETLAAWADGGLSSAEGAAVESHLADCDRCTAMLATFVRTTPEAPVTESLWKRWHLRWLVPAATAVTVAALFVLLPRPEPPQVAMVASAPASEAQPRVPTAAPSTAQAPAEKKEQEARTDLKQSTPADTLARRAEPPAGPPQLADEQRAGTVAERPPAAPLNETLTAAPPAAREADRAEAKSADAQSERFSPPVPPANAAPSAPPAPADPARSAAAPSPQAGAGAAFGAAAAARARAVGGTAPDAGSVIEIVSPDPMTRWRVVGAGQVERSTNGGGRWERATLPEAATFTGGSSPSPTVCWLVGRTGSIYVTTDGRRFVRVPFPDRTDFVSILATDGRRATVVTIDGRTMRTDDQGATWTRVAP